MKPSRPLPSNLITLAAQWKLLGMMAVMLARRISMATKQGAWGDARRARMLETFLYSAHVQLSGIISDHSTRSKSLSKDEADALAYLRMVHAMLSVLTLLIRQLGHDLEEHEARAQKLAGGFVFTPETLQPQNMLAPAALDSS